MSGFVGLSALGGIAAARSAVVYPMRNWRKAVANVRSGAKRATIAVIGDSTTMGAGAGSGGSGGLTAAYPHGFVAALAARLSDYVPTSFQSICGGQASLVSYPTYDTRVTLGAGWTTSGGGTIGATFFAFANGSATELTFTPDAAFDRIKVWYYRAPGQGTVAVSVDSDPSLGTINTAGAALYTSQTFNCALGEHEVVLTAGNNGALFIGAVITWNSAVPAIDMIQAGWYGSIAGSWDDTTPAFAPMACLAAFAPDLTVVNLTINDSNAGTAIGTYKAAMAQIVETGQASGDVLFMVGPPSDTVAATNGTLDRYISVLQGLGIQYGINIVNIKDRWKSFAATDPTLPYFDTLHPERLGYEDIAQAIYETLAAQ